MNLTFVDAEQLGHQVIRSGDLENLRRWLSLSYTRLASHLGTNSVSLKKWLADPDSTRRMHSTTVARIGQWSYDAGLMVRNLLDSGVRIQDLTPLSIIAGQMGRSVESLLFTEMCRTGQITCFDLGKLGVYIPHDQIDSLKEAVKR